MTMDWIEQCCDCGVKRPVSEKACIKCGCVEFNICDYNPPHRPLTNSRVGWAENVKNGVS